jgi:hypothetical protein
VNAKLRIDEFLRTEPVIRKDNENITFQGDWIWGFSVSRRILAGRFNVTLTQKKLPGRGGPADSPQALMSKMLSIHANRGARQTAGEPVSRLGLHTDREGSVQQTAEARRAGSFNGQ